MSLQMKWAQSLNHFVRSLHDMKTLEKYNSMIHAGYTTFLLFYREVRFLSDGQPQRPLLIAFSPQPAMSGALESSCGRCCHLVTSHMGI